MTSLFSKRHYEAIGDVLSENRPAIDPEKMDTWKAIRNDLADLFEADNPRFDRKRFEEACER